MPERANSTKQLSPVNDRKKTTPPGRSAQNQDLVRQFIWDVASINVHLEDIRHFWAKELGISGPQWMILMAVADLDRGNGVPVKNVSSMLHVDPSFITTQSKLLEKNGFMRRTPSMEDARVVLMSLSDKASKKIAGLSERRDTISRFVFAEFDQRTMTDLADQLSALKARFEKATLLLAIDD